MNRYRLSIVSAFSTLALVSLVILPAAAVPVDFGFSAAPGRTLGDAPTNTPVGRSLYTQGGTYGDIRANTNTGSTGWFVDNNGTKRDEEIVPGVAHSGSQCVRIGNYYPAGNINALTSPWFRVPAGETGTKDYNANGVTANTSNIIFSFWVRSVTNATPPANQISFMSVAPDDGLGSRWGGSMGIQDDGGGLRVRWANITDRDAGGGATIYSPFLNYAQWYQVKINITFVDGNRSMDTNYIGKPNDIVVLDVYDAASSTVWHADQNTVYTNDGSTMSTGLVTWEDAGFSTNMAINSLQMRMSLNNSLSGSPLNQYVPPRPSGFFIDDFTMQTGAGLQYFTSFEKADPNFWTGNAGNSNWFTSGNCTSGTASGAVGKRSP